MLVFEFATSWALRLLNQSSLVVKPASALFASAYITRMGQARNRVQPCPLYWTLMKPSISNEPPQCVSEGWNHFNVEGVVRIQRIDDITEYAVEFVIPKFDSDEAAIQYVTDKAHRGSQYHMDALSKVGSAANWPAERVKAHSCESEVEHNRKLAEDERNLRCLLGAAMRDNCSFTRRDALQWRVGERGLNELSTAQLIRPDDESFSLTDAGRLAGGELRGDEYDQKRLEKIRQFLVTENNVTIGECMQALAIGNTVADWKAIAEAREKYAVNSEGDIEVDTVSITSATPPQADPATATDAASGRFVLVWAWVYNDE